MDGTLVAELELTVNFITRAFTTMKEELDVKKKKTYEKEDKKMFLSCQLTIHQVLADMS